MSLDHDTYNMKWQFIKKYSGRVYEGTIHLRITLKTKTKTKTKKKQKKPEREFVFVLNWVTINITWYIKYIIIPSKKR